MDLEVGIHDVVTPLITRLCAGVASRTNGEVEIKDFEGGLYAVSLCVVTDDPGKDIPSAWQRLVMWRERSKYRGAQHQWLEEHIEPDGEGGLETPVGKLYLDLYLPFAE